MTIDGMVLQWAAKKCSHLSITKYNPVCEIIIQAIEALELPSS